MASMAEIGALAADAGIRHPERLAKAIAVAWAESGGNPSAVGDKGLQDSKWGPSVGLWQIRSLKAEKGKGTTRDETKLKDPAFNARSMASISKNGADWEPWTVTHISNPAGYMKYTAALVAARPIAAGIAAQRTGSDVVNEVEDVTGAVTELAGTVSDALQVPSKIVRWLTEPGTWTRVAYGAVGAALIVAGLRIVAQPVVDGAADVAGKVARAAITKGK